MSKKDVIKSLKGVAVDHYKNTEDYVTETMPIVIAFYGYAF